MSEDTKDIDKILQEANTALKELREKSEKFGENSHEFKQYQEKSDEAFKKFEEHNQTLVKQLKQEKTEREEKEDEFKQRVTDLETQIATKQAAGIDFRETPEYKAVESLIRFGEKEVGTDEFKTLRTDRGTSGGFMIPTSLDSELMKEINEISPVRPYVRVKKTSTQSHDIIVRDKIIEAYYEGELEEGESDEPGYRKETLTVHRLTITVPFSRPTLMDAAFNLEQEIREVVAEGFAIKEGKLFIKGTGNKRPEGILSNQKVQSLAAETAASGAISGDDIIKLKGELKSGYRPMFALNGRTLARLRMLKGSDGHYIWPQSLQLGAPATLDGVPYVIWPDMPDYVKADGSPIPGAMPIIYGDMKRGYMITDRTETSFIRDEVTGKKKDAIEITFNRYNTGQVIMPEAFLPLKIKA